MLYLQLLQFSLFSALFIFTKVMWCPVKCWSFNGIRISVYIYDGLGSSPSKTLAIQEEEFLKSTIEKYGFLINIEKPIWQPQKEVIWLEITIDLLKPGLIHESYLL